MRLFWTIAILHMATCLPQEETHPQRQALFVKKDVIENGKRVARQTASADQMVQNILQWLQGVYTQNSRRIRQGTLREYLPPINTQKPRPFQPVTQGSLGGADDNNIGGYPPTGSITPQPPFNANGGSNYPSPAIHNGIIPPVQIPNYNLPSSSSQTPDTSTGPTGPSIGFSSSTEFTSSIGPTGLPSPGTDGYPNGPSTAYPSPSSSSTTSSPVGGSSSTEFLSRGGFPTSSTTGGSVTITTTSGGEGLTTTTTGASATGSPTTTTGLPATIFTTTTTTSATPTTTLFDGSLSSTGFPTSSPSPFSAGTSETTTAAPAGSPASSEPDEEPFTSNADTTSQPTSTTPSEEENSIPSAGPDDNKGEENKGDDTKAESTTIASRFGGSGGDDDLNHPPHIHAIDVECSKEMMTIDIEFNRVFDGIIYSKGHYNSPECRYVKENSGQTKYKITVSLNSCGTQFINAFDTEGKSYLENVLVLQNEAGIQEVWDTIRAVRCLWEGNLKKALNVALSVGMLRQEIVTFSGDTAMAKLDIQMGKGPFAPPANGLVKIGEVMTLVVSVTGDSGFDIQVKDCRATDSSGGNAVALTDEQGCILKPKLFGAFQKTRNTGDTGASIIAYAFFNAFKFPDVMDLVMECNVDLCKTDCEICSEPNQKIDPGRRRKRDLYSYNDTSEERPVTVGKMLRVILPEDLSSGEAIINLNSQANSVCMSAHSFVLSSALLISLLTSSCLFSAYIWLKYQRLNVKK